MHVVLVVVAMGAWGSAAATGALPDELAALPALVSDEQGLVDAVRRFDLLQQALARWDLEMAEELNAAGDGLLAEMKRQQVSKRYALVRRAYEFVLQHYRTNARATNYYGELLYDKFGEIGYAVRLWNMAAAIDPKLSAPFNNLAIHHCHVGEYQRGVECFLGALELEPKNPDYLFNLAQTYLVHGPQVQALRNWDTEKVYREAMELSGKAAQYAPDDFELLQDYAINFFAAENFGVEPDWGDAAGAWQKARAYAPDEAKVFYTWLNEARAWIRRPDAHKAEHCLEQALAICPQSEVVRRLLDEVVEKRSVAP